MDIAVLQKLAPPGVTLLIAFLAYSSQYLFLNLEPQPLQSSEKYIFNGLVICLLIAYWRTCLTDPGKIPINWQELASSATEGDSKAAQQQGGAQKQRWCRKCEMYKPARAHHCKTCRRCIPKMDHHCVWTANCISHTTFPHFLRFLLYAVAAMLYLESLLYERCAVLWRKRHLPSYLGPTVSQLIHLLTLTLLDSFILFMLAIMLARTLYGLAFNITTIETWEIERHETLLRRARAQGGWLQAPDGSKIRIERQEFPWDVGVWRNVCQGMGSRNPVVWIWPLAGDLEVGMGGLVFEHNEIEDPSKPWPPPDPDRIFRAIPRAPPSGNGFTRSMDVEDFRRRQQADLKRYAEADLIDGELTGGFVVHRRPFHERLEDVEAASRREASSGSEADGSDPEPEPEDALGISTTERVRENEDRGEESWRNREGESLADFGVDEVADFYDEEDDDVPIAELLGRRRNGN